MATVSELITQAETLSEEVYAPASWIGFINNALDDLTPVAKQLENTEITGVTVTDNRAVVDVSTSVALTSAFEVINLSYKATQPTAGEFKRLRRLPMADNMSQGYKLTPGELIIMNLPAGITEISIMADYYKTLGHVTAVGDTPDLLVKYHSLLVLYMCAKAMQKEEEPQPRNDYYAEYLVGKNSMAVERMWEAEPQNRRFIKGALMASRIGLPG